MCGIIGYTGKREATPIIIDGLRRLEYRGYDSAGIARDEGGKIAVHRRKGKINELDALLREHKSDSKTAVGHTRWATHGRPSEENAHPHRSDGIVVVHNGIIENYLDLKHELEQAGYRFSSETDTEVICHLIHQQSSGVSLAEAVRKALKKVHGAYAIAVMSEAEPGTIVAVRKDSPLVAGIGDGEYFIASDIPAFLSHSRNVVFFNDNEMAVIRPSGIEFATLEGARIEKPAVLIDWSPSMAEKGGFKHFMLKEIFEQPRAIADTITGRLASHETGRVNLEEFSLDESMLKNAERIFIVACGTSWHAGMVGKYFIEDFARVPVEVDVASEFRYRNPVIGPSDLFVSITQSGETADTLAAQRLAKSVGARTLNICNVVGSTSSREADSVFFTRSGPEIGVASTKAFTAQLAALYMLAIGIGTARGRIKPEAARSLVESLLSVPDRIERALKQNSAIEEIAREFHKREAFLYLGRGAQFPIALEGALKLKEISYIHAQAYAAGEMKHGPIALIDEGYPVVVIAQRDQLYEKVASNIQEIKSRGGRIIMITNESNAADAARIADRLITVPDTPAEVSAMLMAVPLQLLAYHIGVLRGCDVDQPRNLAKSVTVE